MKKTTMRWLYLGTVALSVLAGFVVLVIYQLRFRIEKDPLSQYQILDAEQTMFVWNLETQPLAADNWSVSGWIVEPGKEYRGLNGGNGDENVGVYNCVWVAFLDHESETVYRLPTQAYVPEGGDPYPEDGIDHKNCAFVSKTNKKHWENLQDMQLYLAVKTYEDNWYLIPTERRL